jgi:hypothetical protein
MIVVVNATENHILPSLIFLRVHCRDHRLNGASTASAGG